MERKLASVQRAMAILPIENADAIELVSINGWQCVTKKGEFQVGDPGVFFEIDAIPPDMALFRFLWTPKQTEPIEGIAQVCARPEKFRIRTMRLRGALSQGLFMPLTAFPELGDGLTEGENVTEILGVGKYEPPMPQGMGAFRAHFPGFIPKTDEMRVQSVPAVLEEIKGLPYVITLKYDGTSATFCIDPRDGAFHACGRNLSLQDGNNPYWNVAQKYDIEAVLRRAPHLAIQGEIVGPGLQKNRLNLKEVALFAFNVYDIPAARYLPPDEARAFLADANIPAVAIIEQGERFALTQEDLLRRAEGFYPDTKNER